MKVFRIRPKRIKRTNGTVLTPDMEVTVTTRMHTNDPFYNGGQEVAEMYMRIYGFDYKKPAATKSILNLRRWGKYLAFIELT